MKKYRFRNIFSVFVVLIFSVDLHAGAGTYKFKQIGALMDNGVAYAILQVDGNLSSVPSCGSSNSHKISFKIDDDVGNLKYSTALAAVMSGNEVWISWSDDSCGLWGIIPLVGRFDVKSQ